MAKGGIRSPETLFKPKWKHPTTAIRVPEIFAAQLVELARQWDANGEPTSSTDQQQGFTREALEMIASELLNDPDLTRQGKDRGTVKRAIATFIARLVP